MCLKEQEEVMDSKGPKKAALKRILKGIELTRRAKPLKVQEGGCVLMELERHLKMEHRT